MIQVIIGWLMWIYGTNFLFRFNMNKKRGLGKVVGDWKLEIQIWGFVRSLLEKKNLLNLII